MRTWILVAVALLSFASTADIDKEARVRLLSEHLYHEVTKLGAHSHWFDVTDIPSFRAGMQWIHSNVKTNAVEWNALNDFLTVRNRVVAGEKVDEKDLWAAIEEGEQVIKEFHALHQESIIAKTAALFYDDPQCTKEHQGLRVSAVVQIGADGTADLGYYPIFLNQPLGEDLSWEWDRSIGLDNKWFFDSKGNCAEVWYSSVVFAGKPMKGIISKLAPIDDQPL
jgi:hypothetical protein